MSNWKKTDSIIWMTLFLVVIVVAVIANSMSSSINREIEDEYFVSQSVLAESAAKTVKLYFTEVETELRVLSTVPEIKNLELVRATRKLQHILTAHSDKIKTIILVDYLGRIVVSEKRMRTPEIESFAAAIYKRMLKGGKNRRVHLDMPMISNEIKIPGQFEGFALSVPIYKQTGARSGVITGMLVAMISRELLDENLLKPISFRNGSAAFILTHSGTGVVAPGGKEMVGDLLNHLNSDDAGIAIFEKMLKGEKDSVWLYLTGRREALLSFAGVKFAGVNWSVGILTPQKAITRIVQKSRMQLLGLATFVAMVLYLLAITLLKINRSRIIAREKAQHASELAEKNRELERLSRMKDEFVSIVSHDLRSPIHLISSYAKMMLPEAEETEKNVKPLKAIIRSSERVTTLINDILDLARVEAGEMKVNYSEVDIDRLVQESFRAVQFNAEQKRIRLLYEQENGPRTLTADNNKLFQVLNNLLGNAIKFTPEEGVVTVRKSSDNGNLLMTVSDTGPGLDPEQQKSIFEKFKQAGDHHGSGLGLAICKNLVELQNGKIWVESEPGKGAYFKFTIPVRREKNAEKSAGD